MYVVTTDPSADKPDVVRAASGERFVFRTNPDSDVEDAHPKIAYAITKGLYQYTGYITLQVRNTNIKSITIYSTALKWTLSYSAPYYLLANIT